MSFSWSILVVLKSRKNKKKSIRFFLLIPWLEESNDVGGVSVRTCWALESPEHYILYDLHEFEAVISSPWWSRLDTKPCCSDLPTPRSDLLKHWHCTSWTFKCIDQYLSCAIVGRRWVCDVCWNSYAAILTQLIVCHLEDMLTYLGQLRLGVDRYLTKITMIIVVATSGGWLDQSLAWVRGWHWSSARFLATGGWSWLLDFLFLLLLVLVLHGAGGGAAGQHQVAVVHTQPGDGGRNYFEHKNICDSYLLSGSVWLALVIWLTPLTLMLLLWILFNFYLITLIFTQFKA